MSRVVGLRWPTSNNRGWTGMMAKRFAFYSPIMRAEPAPVKPSGSLPRLRRRLLLRGRRGLLDGRLFLRRRRSRRDARRVLRALVDRLLGRRLGSRRQGEHGDERDQ